MFQITITGATLQELKTKTTVIYQDLVGEDAGEIQKEKKPRKSKNDDAYVESSESGNTVVLAEKKETGKKQSGVTYDQVKDATLELAKHSRPAALEVLARFPNKSDGKTPCKLATDLHENDWPEFVKVAGEKVQELEKKDVA